jgi:hypothetical protein
MHEIGNNGSAVLKTEGASSAQLMDSIPLQLDIPLSDSTYQKSGKIKTILITPKTLSPDPAALLSSGEFRELHACETTIANEWESFVKVGRELAKFREEQTHREWDAFLKVGQALARIKEGKLYRHNYPTFAHYCRDKWHYGKSQAYRLIAAAEAFLCLSPRGDTLPRNEKQIRPLNGLNDEQKCIAWEKALVLAGDKEISVKHVKAAVAEINPKHKCRKTRAKQSAARVADSEDDWQKAHLLVRNALCFLKKSPENAEGLLKSLDEHLYKLELARGGHLEK